MSSKKQDKSVDQQLLELRKLAARDGYEIVGQFSDHAISGDTSTDDRPGLAALIEGAEARRFKVILCWHTNRLSREEPMDALALYNRLRKAGITVVSACEGRIDLDDFSRQLLLFVNQKGSSDYLREHSQKICRSKIAGAKHGAWAGGPRIYGMDRALFGPDGKMVCRLAPGETRRIKGHHTRLIPSDDPQRIAAVRYLFARFDESDIGFRELAKEMNARGFPTPGGRGWTHTSVLRLLGTPQYIGTARWGVRTSAAYYTSAGENIVPVVNGNGGPRRKQEEDLIVVADAYPAIIEADQFGSVQRKLARREKRRVGRRGSFALVGLAHCAHCGAKLMGWTGHSKDRHGRNAYTYRKMVCGTYARYGRDRNANPTCGHHTVDHDRLLAWLVDAIRREYLGPGREALESEIRTQLRQEAKSGTGDTRRVEKELAAVEKQITNLVQAVRLADDVPELIAELREARLQRDRLRGELDRLGRIGTAKDLDAEARRIAERLWEGANRLETADAATLRELLREIVVRVEIEWEKRRTAAGNERCQVVGGEAEVRDGWLFGVVADMGRVLQRA